MPPPEECQLFNMETAVTTLETMVSLGTPGRAATPAERSRRSLEDRSGLPKSGLNERKETKGVKKPRRREGM